MRGVERNRSKKTYITTIYLKDIENHIEKLKNKGYTIKDAIRVGAYILSNLEVYFKNVNELMKNIEEKRDIINNLLFYTEKASIIIPTILKTLHKLERTVKDLENASSKLDENMKKTLEEMDIKFKELFEKFDYFIILTIKTDCELIMQLAETIEKDIDLLVNIYKIPEHEPSIKRMRYFLGEIQKICKKYLDTNNKKENNSEVNPIHSS